MTTSSFRHFLLSAVSGACLLLTSSETAAQAFTYQGELNAQGSPTNAICDFRFTLFDAEVNGSQIGAPDEHLGANVVDGIFSLSLDFGSSPFDGQDLWLGIEVRCPTSAGNYTALNPRQPISPTPYAIRSLNGGGAFTLNNGNAIFTGGQVGIGTSSPTSILHLRNGGPSIALSMRSNASWTAQLIQTESSLLSLTNGGTERLSITSNGRFGFNTTDPAGVVNIVSNADPGIRVEPSAVSGQDSIITIVGARNGDTTADAARINLNDFDSDEGAGTEFTMARIAAGMADVSGQSGFLRFYTNAGADLQERMVIDKNGNAGIGVPTPFQRLEVAGDMRIGGGGVGLEDGLAEYLAIRGLVNDWYLGVRNEPSIDLTAFFIGLNESAEFAPFYLKRSGELGLGRIPLHALDIARPGDLTLRLAADTDNSDESERPFLLMTKDGGNSRINLTFSGSTDNASISTVSTESSFSHLLLQPKGFVGIQTFNPQAILDVEGPGTDAAGIPGADNVVARFRQTTASTPSALAIDALNSQDAILYFSENGAASYSIRADASHPVFNIPTLDFRWHDGGTENTSLFRVTPQFLYPSTDGVMSLGLDIGGTHAWETVYTYAVDNVSDRRAKKHIKPLDYGIDAVMRLQPVSFRWRTESDHSDLSLGVIAQDVLKVVPEVVSGDVENEQSRLSVKYTELIPVLIRGMQEQQEQLDDLAAENDEMRERIAALESMVIESVAAQRR